MKGIKITEKNYKDVFSRLEKFFAHEDFLVWHSFGGGMRKHISSKFYSKMGNCVHDSKRKYYNVTTEIREDLVKKSPRFCVYMNDDEGFGLTIGDELLFVSNRIIFKEPFTIHYFDDKDELQINRTFCYLCFQILK